MFGEIRTNAKSVTKDRAEVERYSKDFRVSVAIDFSKKPEPVKSGMKILDGLLKNVKFSVSVSKEGVEDPKLIEHIGFAMGEALRRIHEKRKTKPLASSIHSDRRMMCMFAINLRNQGGEANLQIIGKPEFDTELLFAFFDGFAQGLSSEINAVVNLSGGRNHLDFISKAFASSLERIFEQG